jgi:flagellar FliL protein
MAEAAAEDKSKPTGDPARLGKILKVVFLVVNLVVLGAGAAFVYTTTVGYHPAVVTNEEVLAQLEKERGQVASKPVLYTMDKFTANLDGFPTRVLQTQLNLEMLDEDGFEEVVTMGSQARDLIMRILNGKRFQEVETSQGKLFLKDQIRTALNSQLKRGVIKDVYFSEFVVQ